MFLREEYRGRDLESELSDIPRHVVNASGLLLHRQLTVASIGRRLVETAVRVTSLAECRTKRLMDLFLLELFPVHYLFHAWYR